MPQLVHQLIDETSNRSEGQHVLLEMSPLSAGVRKHVLFKYSRGSVQAKDSREPDVCRLRGGSRLLEKFCQRRIESEPQLREGKQIHDARIDYSPFPGQGCLSEHMVDHGLLAPYARFSRKPAMVFGNVARDPDQPALIVIVPPAGAVGRADSLLIFYPL